MLLCPCAGSFHWTRDSSKKLLSWTKEKPVAGSDRPPAAPPRPSPRFSFTSIRCSCYSASRNVVHRQQANYVQVVHVDYLDYDEDDYFRFRRVEKQLAN